MIAADICIPLIHEAQAERSDANWTSIARLARDAFIRLDDAAKVFWRADLPGRAAGDELLTNCLDIVAAINGMAGVLEMVSNGAARFPDAVPDPLTAWSNALLKLVSDLIAAINPSSVVMAKVDVVPPSLN